MMNMHQDIHGVHKVRAVRLSPQNRNAVTIEIDAEGGLLQQTLYFGCSAYATGVANEFFYALKGDPADVIGSAAEAQRDAGE